MTAEAIEFRHGDSVYRIENAHGLRRHLADGKVVFEAPIMPWFPFLPLQLFAKLAVELKAGVVKP